MELSLSAPLSEALAELKQSLPESMGAVVLAVTISPLLVKCLKLPMGLWTQQQPQLPMSWIQPLDDSLALGWLSSTCSQRRVPRCHPRGRGGSETPPITCAATVCNHSWTKAHRLALREQCTRRNLDA